MDLQQVLEDALKEPEREWLDFKATYDGSSEDHRVELVKDVSAMANSVDRPGYLIIGVNWKPGQQPKPAKFAGGIEEAHLQQLIRSKLNRPVRFEYQEIPYQGKTVGIISIPYSDAKPHQVKVDFIGKKKSIRKGQVFVRRGTSTEPATVEEIIEMSLNAVNDLSKIDEEDLYARVIVLLRRRDYVGIGEMLRQAPRPIEQTMRSLPTDKMTRSLSLRPAAPGISKRICSCCSRVSVIGFAISGYRCLECYDDLLRCLARLYLVSQNEDAIRAHRAATVVWRSILALAAYATGHHNWSFLETLLRHRITLPNGEREYLFVHPLRANDHELLDASGRLFLDNSFLEEIACDSESLDRALCEYDFLAHFRAHKLGSNYCANWNRHGPQGVKDLIREIRENPDVAAALGVRFDLARPIEFKRALDNFYNRYVGAHQEL